MALIEGDGGPNTLDGSASDDTINGFGGNDTIRSFGGMDEIHAGDGDDSVNGNQTSGLAWTGFLFSGPILAYGEAGDDHLIGTTGDDTLDGGADDDFIVGYTGADSLLGDGGADTIQGGDDNDELFGGAGIDSLFGQGGDDTIEGGDDADSISGGDDNDSILAGAGDDTASGNDGDDYIQGDDGDDTLYGGIGLDTLLGGADHDTVYANEGNDSVDGGSGNDGLFGGSGADTMLGGTGADSLYGNEDNDSLTGGDGADELFGMLGNDTLLGSADNDTLSGDEDDDSLTGGAGDDSLIGGDGNDTLVDDGGYDILRGGAGNDTYYINSQDFFISDTGGSNSIIVQENFVKVPTSVDASPTYAAGIMALPYWLDAMLPEDANRFKSLLGGSTTISYSFPTTTPGYTDSGDTSGWTAMNGAQQSFVTGIFSYISGVVNLSFSLTTTHDAANVMTFANNTQTGTAGYAYYPNTTSIGSDVFFNKGTAGNLAPMDGESAALTYIHEIGHALGLKHPFEDGPTLPDNDGDPDLDEDTTAWTVMSYDSFAADYHAVFQPLDVAAMHYLYGPSASLNAGNTTHAITEADTNFIADGAGTDTIDASGASEQVTVYLTPGYWGFVGAAKAASGLITADGQITVNFGTVIENLLGSAFADTLVGNEAGNDISGGAGNDSITGGDGNDTLNGGTGTDNAVYSGIQANYTITDNGGGSFTVTDNVGDEGSDSLSNMENAQFSDGTVALTADLTPPTIAVGTDDSELNAGDTATIAFTLSEVSTDFTAGDVSVSGGTLSGFSGSGTSYTATFTPDADSIANGTVSVASGTFSDAAANFNTDGADANNSVTMTVDTVLPTIAIGSDDTDLTLGETATITFALSEASTDFTAGDVTVSGGALSGFSGSGSSYSATFTPASDSTTDGVVSVASSTFSDGAGNFNADGAEANNTVTMTVDTQPADNTPPTITVATDDSELNAGDTAAITFTLSEASTDFTAGDITVSGGTLSGFSGSGTSYSATFTPDADSTANGTVSVASGTFSDAAANFNADGADADNSVTMTVDTVLPTIAVSTDDSELNAGDTATISFTLSEASTDFTVGDISVSGGTLSGFGGSGTSYSATFTPDADSTTDGVVSVASSTFSDAAGNFNGDGADADNTTTLSVDTVLPTIAVTSDSGDLAGGDTATVTFTLSEAATDFDTGDVSVSGGTLSGFAGAGTVYTATFTPDADSTADGVVSVASSTFSDAADNFNADGAEANNTVTMAVDTAPPTIAVSSDDADLTKGETATITFTLSDAVSDFTVADVVVSGGTLFGFSGSGTSYTATFTPDDESTVNGVVSVASGTFTDAVGNPNTDGADANNTLTMTVNTLSVDNTPPTIAISSNDSTLNAAETATITFSLSESSSDFTAGDVMVTGGTLSGFAGSGSSYSATFTPTANSTANGTVSVASGTFSDAAANFNVDGADADNSVTLTVDTILPTLSISSDDDDLTEGETASITFTLSEASSDFTAGDVAVSGGTLSGFAGAGILYTATFTPDAESTVDGVVSVSSGAFTDGAGNANADGADADNSVTMNVNTFASIAGTVADGYVAGAAIYIDANNDGVPDAGEDSGVTTDASGNFSLAANLATAPILAVGGTNIDTGLANTLVLSAPQGGTLVNPLTTLIQQIIYAQGGSVEDAEALVQNALGIESDLDLTRYDPLAQVPEDDDAVTAQKLAAQLAVLVTLAEDSGLFGDIAAYMIANPGQVLDLTSYSFINTMLPEVDDEVLVQAAAVNQVLENAVSLAAISQTQGGGLDSNNDAPLVNGLFTGQFAYGDAEFEFMVPDGLFIDLDSGDTLSYAATLSDASPLPAWLGFDPLTQTFSGTAGIGDIDRLSVKVSVTDSGSESVSAPFELVVQMGSDRIENLDGSDGFRLDGVAAIDRTGWSVSGAGDFNGDGFGDLLIGAFRAEPNGDDSGTAYLVFGKAEGFAAISSLGDLDGTDGFRLDGLAEGDRNGWSVSGAGDVNGDGLDDIIIGALEAAPGGKADAGSSYVVFGSDAVFTANFDLASLDGSNGFRLDGDVAQDESGISVSAAGDVNGDGFADLIVGASSADYNGNFAGAGYVIFGGDSGFPATLDLGDLDGSNGFRLEGAATFDRLGESVSSAGDVNNDGFDDVIVGAWGADNNGASSGSAYVFYGKESGFAATVNVADLDGSDGFRLDGGSPGDTTGYAVSAAGDINGDGIDDIIISGYQTDFNGENAGAAYVVFGSEAGFAASMNLDDLDGSDGFRLNGVSADLDTGETVSSAGDFNDDGFDDLLIGAWRTAVNGDLTGSAYLVFGSGSGFPAVLELAELNGSTGFRLDGESAGDLFGYHVSAAGDVNNDGAGDIIIGAPSADYGGNTSGSAYVLFGTPDSGLLVEGGPGNDSLSGAEGNDTLLGFGGRDTLEGLAGNDVLDGGDDIDHAGFQGELLDYGVVNDGGQLTVTGPVSDGIDTLIDVERLAFGSSSLAFDLDGNAGMSVKLLGTMLGAGQATNQELVGIALDIFDNAGLSFEQVMDIALDVVLGPGASNGAVVDLIWQNLVGGPTPEDLRSDLVASMNAGAFSQAELAVLAAEHPINQENIGLVGLIENGVEYFPVG